MSSSQQSSNSVVTLEVKTLQGKTVILSHVPVDTTMESLYQRVRDEAETNTPYGKWKLMINTPSLRTLKWSEKHRQLNEFGLVDTTIQDDDKPYRVEVVLDMGACHGPLCRK